MQAWSRPKENICVADRTGKQPYQSVAAAVCACHKVLAVKQIDFAFTEDSYCEYLEDIAGACGNETIYLF